MPRGGHNKVPAALKLVRGTFQPCRDKAPEPRLDRVSVPPPPKGMEGLQRDVWLRLRSEVEEAGTYTAAYRTAFLLMVAAVVDAEIIANDPDEPGSTRIKARQAALHHIETFGCTAASASKVPGAPDRHEVEDPTAEFGA